MATSNGRREEGAFRGKIASFHSALSVIACQNVDRGPFTTKMSHNDRNIPNEPDDRRALEAFNFVSLREGVEIDLKDWESSFPSDALESSSENHRNF